MHDTQEEICVGIISGKDDVPVFLEKYQDAEKVEAFIKGLLRLGKAIKYDFI